MRGIYLQETEVPRLKDIQPNNDIALPLSLARFSLRILSLFLHGIYNHVLRTRRKYMIHRDSLKFNSSIYSASLTHFPFSFFQLGPILKNSEKVQTLLKTRWEARILAWIFLKLYTFVFMGYCLLSFVLLSYSRYNQVYTSMYYCGHIFFISYLLFSPYIKRLIRQRHECQRSHQE